MEVRGGKVMENTRNARNIELVIVIIGELIFKCTW